MNLRWSVGRKSLLQDHRFTRDKNSDNQLPTQRTEEKFVNGKADGQDAPNDPSLEENTVSLALNNYALPYQIILTNNHYGSYFIWVTMTLINDYLLNKVSGDVAIQWFLFHE